MGARHPQNHAVHAVNNPSAAAPLHYKYDANNHFLAGTDARRIGFSDLQICESLSTALRSLLEGSSR